MQPFMSDLFHWVDSRAPFDTQADFDNSGFLVGRKDAPVQNILFALDVSDRVLDEAEAHGANLIITHHPMMFSPVQSITEDDVEEIIRTLKDVESVEDKYILKKGK